jgi:hypothetical protein
MAKGKGYGGKMTPKGPNKGPSASSSGASIEKGLIEQKGIPDCPVHDRQPPNFVPPSPQAESVGRAGTTFKIK